MNAQQARIEALLYEIAEYAREIREVSLYDILRLDAEGYDLAALTGDLKAIHLNGSIYDEGF